ncbi:MAG: hypothetical protein NC085_10025 [Muribaculaceae bacterium]|nr:hypothetical protein [Muribaculaceae bacterium]
MAAGDKKKLFHEKNSSKNNIVIYILQQNLNFCNVFLKFLPKIEKIKFPEKTILNINTPALEEADIAGVEITKLGSKMFTDEYEKRI